MVRIINIDTKTRTIRVENADSDIKTWRTTESGAHFPIRKGESTKEALDKFVGSKRQESNPGGTKIETSKVRSGDIISFGKDSKKYEVRGFTGKGMGSEKFALREIGSGKESYRTVGDGTEIYKHEKESGQQPAKKDENPSYIKIPKGASQMGPVPDHVAERHIKTIKEPAKKESGSDAGLDRELARGGLSDDEISILRNRLQDYYDISDQTLLSAIKSGEYSVKEIYKRLRNYDDDFADHLVDLEDGTVPESKQQFVWSEKEKQQPAKKEFDKELWDKAYEAAKKRVKGVKNPYPTHDDVQSMYEYMQSDDYKKSTEKASFKSAMQTTMKAFPRLYDFEKPHLEEFANKVYEDIQNNPGKEKEVLEHLADAYKRHIAGLGPWVDTPTLAKKAFLDQMLESHLNKQPKQSSQPTSYDLDDAFDEADLGSEWGRAKHRMDFHGVSQYTIKDIIDSGKYEAGDIIEALESNSHDKIDEMRKSLKNK